MEQERSVFKDNYDKMMDVSSPKVGFSTLFFKSKTLPIYFDEILICMEIADFKYLKSHSLGKFPYLASPLQ